MSDLKHSLNSNAVRIMPGNLKNPKPISKSHATETVVEGEINLELHSKIMHLNSVRLISAKPSSNFHAIEIMPD